MLVIAGTISLDPANRDKAIAAANKVMAATRQESGCVSYVFSADFEDPGLFHLFEEWESQAALDSHFTQPHMAEFQKAMGGFGVKGLDIHKYQVSKKGGVRD